MSKKLASVLQEEGYLAYRLAADDISVSGALMDIESLLSAVGHLLEANDEEILPNPGDLYGLGSLLKQKAQELRQVRNFAEHAIRPRTRK